MMFNEAITGAKERHYVFYDKKPCRLVDEAGLM
jgi:hypothetical protein